jgi:DUF2946 family protein
MKCPVTSKRAFLAVVACVALLYFAAGGALLHHHTGSAGTACHVCQSLHIPALAATSLHVIPEALRVTRHAVLPDNAAPLEPFALHRASRAPPAA